MQTERPSFYRDVHKGIRALLSALVDRAARTDFADPASVGRLRSEAIDAFAMLEAHAHHENAFVGPLLRAHAPEIAARLEGEHHEHEERVRDLLALLSGEERASIPGWTRGHAFCVALTRFVGELYTHMADEEEQSMPALWAALDDAEIEGAHVALVSSIAPAEMMAFLRWMLPSIRHVDRVGMLSGMRASAPPEAFAAVMELARGVLSPADREALEAAMSIPRAA